MCVSVIRWKNIWQDSQTACHRTLILLLPYSDRILPESYETLSEAGMPGTATPNVLTRGTLTLRTASHAACTYPRSVCTSCPKLSMHSFCLLSLLQADAEVCAGGCHFCVRDDASSAWAVSVELHRSQSLSRLGAPHLS